MGRPGPSNSKETPWVPLLAREIAKNRGEGRKSKRLDGVAVKVLLPKHVRIEGLTSQNLRLDAHEYKGWGRTSTISTNIFVKNWGNGQKGGTVPQKGTLAFQRQAVNLLRSIKGEIGFDGRGSKVVVAYIPPSSTLKPMQNCRKS